MAKQVSTSLYLALILKAVVQSTSWQIYLAIRFLLPFPASALSNSASAGGAVDGLHTIDTCYRSQSPGPHWWMVDLGRETAIGKIRFTVTVSAVVYIDYHRNCDVYHIRVELALQKPLTV